MINHFHLDIFAALFLNCATGHEPRFELPTDSLPTLDLQFFTIYSSPPLFFSFTRSVWKKNAGYREAFARRALILVAPANSTFHEGYTLFTRTSTQAVAADEDFLPTTNTNE